jgi:hypothetical protein
LYRINPGIIGTAGQLNAIQGFIATGMAGIGNVAFGSYIAGDIQNRFVIGADGRFSWGPGNAGMDTDLYRNTPGVLATDGVIQILGSGPAALRTFIPSGTGNVLAQRLNQNDATASFIINNLGLLNWGPGGSAALDTNLYRFAANLLKTDGGIITIGEPVAPRRGFFFNPITGQGVGLRIQAQSEAFQRFDVYWDGSMAFGSGSAAVDTYIWRAAAGVMGFEALAVFGYGTSLPATPTDGQEYILVDSTTNPTYQWRFRYNAGSTSPYKWECVGGSPITVYIPDSVTPSTLSAWADLSGGPVITVPHAGDYLLSFGARCNVWGSSQSSLGVRGGGATDGSTLGDDVWFTNQNTGGLWETIRQEVRRNVNAAGAVLTMQAKTTGADISGRSLAITPIRVA